MAIRPRAVANAVGKDAQAHCTSKVPARLAPSFSWTTTEVEGVTKSGESVPSTIRSTSADATPARARACSAAATARSLVA